MAQVTEVGYNGTGSRLDEAAAAVALQTGLELESDAPGTASAEVSPAPAYGVVTAEEAPPATPLLAAPPAAVLAPLPLPLPLPLDL